MKKNYIIFIVLIIVTVVVTLMFSNIYKREINKSSYAFENLNKITSEEFDEYILENPDTIIYISDKNDLEYNKFEKKFVNKLKKLNLLENVIYVEKSEINKSLQKKLKENYSYSYNKDELPIIIVINNGKIIEKSIITENNDVNTIINYEVFE